MLDGICHAYYGRTEGVLERVLGANRHLALLPPVFEAGVEILLPDLPQEGKKTIKLWP